MKEGGRAVGSGDQRPGARRAVVPGTFADVLARAIARRGRSLNWLHQRLRERGDPVSIATLSYWRSGQRRPDGPGSLAAVSTLEELLGLDRGDLLDRVVPARRPGPSLPRRLSKGDGYEVGELRQTMDRLPVERPDGLRYLHHSAAVDVDVDGLIRRTTLRMVLQAREDGVDAFRHLVYAPTPQPEAPVRRAGAGCRVMATYDHPGRKVFGAVMALDRTLLVGQTTVVEFTVEVPPGFAQGDWYQHTAMVRLQELLLWIRFDPRMVPVRYEEYVDLDGDETSVPHAVTGHAIHVVRRDIGPGTIGLRWSY